MENKIIIQIKSNRYPSFANIPAVWLILGLVLLPGSIGLCVTAARYRTLADSSLAGKQYQQAAGFYRLESQVYSHEGDVNAAKVEEMKAEHWASEVQLYQTIPPNRQELQQHYTGAKYEPLYGCYLGAYALTDFDLPVLKDPDGRRLSAEATFGEVVHKHLATAFDYCRYGDKFPVNWAKDLTGRGIAPHISMEPNDGLQYVKDDE
ncbi:MAG: hypothetical protein M3Y56_05590, partial [Armatimonadota bacterium]|nr:hypothetical protein [Armatimonadota bacterium]